MNAAVSALIEKARRSLSASRNLLEQGHFDFSASRSYYAMFYMAEAGLISRGLSNSAVIAAFGEHYVKTGLLPAELHASLRDAFAQRNLGDYGYARQFPGDIATRLLEQAERFVAAVEAFLQR